MADESHKQAGESLEEAVATCPACQTNRCGLFPVLIALIVVVGAIVLHRRTGDDELIGPPLAAALVKDLKNTEVSAHPDVAITPGKNLIWCSTFQLLWKDISQYAGGDLHLENEPPIIKLLNQKYASQGDLDPDNYLVMSGNIEEGIVDRICTTLDHRFHGRTNLTIFSRLLLRLPSEGYLGYAGLFAEMAFEYRFRRLTQPLLFAGVPVLAFGLTPSDLQPEELRLTEQIVVLDYAGPDDFIIELKLKNKDERLILAKIVPADTLQKTIEAVMTRATKTDANDMQKRFQPGESLAVPVFNIDLWQEYDELYQKPITTPGPLKDKILVMLVQNIRFRLDRNGALLKPASLTTTEDIQKMQEKRHFIFDKPFLILLQRHPADQPYFALWLDNPELLTKINK